ncbi:MAG: agmatine deiminase family protein [Verrucomicrobiota bacterium]
MLVHRFLSLASCELFLQLTTIILRALRLSPAAMNINGKPIALTVAICFAGFGAPAQEQTAVGPGKPLIIFHAPSVNETYYAPKFQLLLGFYRDFVQATHPLDFPIVVCDAATRPQLEALIDPAHLLTAGVRDIWVRDFGPISTPRGVFKPIYRPNYLSAEDAAWIEQGFVSFFPQLKIPSHNFPLIIDGGNFVGNEANRAVITNRVLADNPGKSEAQIRAMFRDQLGIDQLAIIPAEAGDTTGHSDGMVKWITKDVLAINRYGRNFRNQVRNSLTQQLPGITIVEVPWNPTNRSWRGFADATGVYTNAMSTPNALYVPMYGLNTDDQALAAYRAHADRPVIGVPIDPEIAIMGGAARCLCWQVSGTATANSPFGFESLDLSGAVEDLEIHQPNAGIIDLSWRTIGVEFSRTPGQTQMLYPSSRVQRSFDLINWQDTGHNFVAAGAPANHSVRLTGQNAETTFYRIGLHLE